MTAKYKKIIYYLVFIVLFMNLFLLFLYSINYDVLLFKKGSYLIPIFINIIALILLSTISSGKSLVTLVIIIGLLLLLLLKSIFTQLFHPYSYEQVTSPINNKVILTEYRKSLLDGKVSFYRIYQVKFVVFTKQLTKKEIVIDYPYTLDPSQKEVFDYEAPEWRGENTVIFHTIEGPRRFIMD
ncbi:hypothetical protein [Paenibacillus polymyxa]|uniref:hypothetical protein n=1 Tax=Paenibacillus polymyxa TaxID=1406 RepID=UPI002AB59741|nr:hypothetical protein [Paenibacillus polymyxa]MDY8024238.1 hypothetical protein [Paenibacillus polymyxa]